MDRATKTKDEDSAFEKAEEQEDAFFHLSDDEIKDIVEALHAQDSDTVHAALYDLSNADTAELLSKIKPEDREELLSTYQEVLDPLLFTDMDAGLRNATLSAMPAAQIAEMISEMETDDALLLIEQLEPEFQKDIIRKLSARMRIVLEEGLNFPEDSAGRLMRRELVAIPEFWTVGKTLDYLRAASDSLPEDFLDLFIIDPSYHLKGKSP